MELTQTNVILTEIREWEVILDMLSKTTLDNGIILVSHEGYLSLEEWDAYKNMLVEALDESDDLVYILSDFTGTETFGKEILGQVGTAPHLAHPHLGMIVLLGGNALQNFVLQITDNRARKEAKDSKLRVHTDYDRAIDTLLHFKKIHKEGTEA